VLWRRARDRTPKGLAARWISRSRALRPRSVLVGPHSFGDAQLTTARVEWHDGSLLAVYTNRPRLFARLWAIPGVRRHQTGDREMRAVFPVEALAAVAAHHPGPAASGWRRDARGARACPPEPPQPLDDGNFPGPGGSSSESDAAGICVRGFQMLQPESQRLPWATPLSSPARAISYVARTR
jgi:hypothetical protein